MIYRTITSEAKSITDTIQEIDKIEDEKANELLENLAPIDKITQEVIQ